MALASLLVFQFWNLCRQVNGFAAEWSGESTILLWGFFVFHYNKVRGMVVLEAVLSHFLGIY